MPYCPRCGKEVAPDTRFCSNCGADLSTGRPPRIEVAKEKAEKSEKQEKKEKSEKSEKGEKHEKEESSPYGALVGGLFLIFLGVTFYLATVQAISFRDVWPFFLIVLGLIIAAVGVIAYTNARKRSPRP